jgi:hypothetical protein
MEKGNIIYDPPSLTKIRERFLENLEKLPDELKSIDEVSGYKVEIGTSLKKIIRKLKLKIRGS